MSKIACQDGPLELCPNDSHNYLKYLNPPNPLIPHNRPPSKAPKTLDRQCTLEAGEGYSCKSQFITIHHISRRFQMPTCRPLRLRSSSPWLEGRPSPPRPRTPASTAPPSTIGSAPSPHSKSPS